MDKNSNSYTIIYSAGMVIVVSLLLSFVSASLGKRQADNVKLDKKKQILSSLRMNFDKQDVNKLYDQYIIGGLIINASGETMSDNAKDKAFEIDLPSELAKPLEKRELPVFLANVDGSNKFIFPLQGNGLWGPIWGYVALDEDKSTIFGAFFSHASETPGLGAEISSKKFQDEFVNKSILNAESQFVSVAVVKPGNKVDGKDYVDGISGSTITSKGVENMIFKSLDQYKGFLMKP